MCWDCRCDVGPLGRRSAVGARVASRRGSALAGTRVQVGVDGLEPGGWVLVARQGLEDREVAHEGVGGRAVPVLLVRRADDGVAGAEAQDAAVARADEPDTLADVKGLADGVPVPVAVRAGGEADEADGQAGRLGAAGDGGDEDVAGEPVGRALVGLRGGGGGGGGGGGVGGLAGGLLWGGGGGGGGGRSGAQEGLDGAALVHG